MCAYQRAKAAAPGWGTCTFYVGGGQGLCTDGVAEEGACSAGGCEALEQDAQRNCGCVALTFVRSGSGAPSDHGWADEGGQGATAARRLLTGLSALRVKDTMALELWLEL